ADAPAPEGASRPRLKKVSTTGNRSARADAEAAGEVAECGPRPCPIGRGPPSATSLGGQQVLSLIGAQARARAVAARQAVGVGVAGLGADADLLELLLADLALAALLRRLEAHLAVVEDLAHRRAVVGGHLHQVEAGLPGFLQSLRGRHEAQLLPIDADQADGA